MPQCSFAYLSPSVPLSMKWRGGLGGEASKSSHHQMYNTNTRHEISHLLPYYLDEDIVQIIQSGFGPELF